MTDLFPQEPPTTRYSSAFEAAWRAHPVGNKLRAWKAGEKAGWSDGNWKWLEQYLTKRHKEDVKWLEGIYIPHMSSIINGERWTDTYRKKKLDRYDKANQEVEASVPADPEVARAAIEAAKRALH